MPREKKRKKSHTSSFGVSSRESHDSSKFYESRLYSQTSTKSSIDDTVFFSKPDRVNIIYTKSSESMEELPDNSIHLVVCSPPYNASKEYDEDLTLKEYLELLNRVWSEVKRVLIPGGRACVNIANLGRKPYIPLHSYVIKDFLKLGFLMRGEVIWDKSASAGTSTAWGSWKASTNPTLRDVHEYILIFSKEKFNRTKSDTKIDTISRDEFLTNTKSVWTFPTASAKEIGHPAPFPVELPYRLIQLYSFKEDIVLDPFMGSGQTAIAALKSSRKYIGYDTSPEYVNLANDRIKNFLEEQRRRSLDDFLPE